MKNNSEPNQYCRDVDFDTDLDREATIIPFPERPKTSEPKQDANLETNDEKPITQQALLDEYIRRGWNPVTIPFRQKGPKGKGWDKQCIDASNVGQYFPANGQWNIGVQLGPKSGGLVDTDIDCPEALQLVPWFFPRTGTVFGRQGKPSSHWIYDSPTLIESAKKAAIQFPDPEATDKEKGMLLELRCGGGDKGAQTVFPGSFHVSGEPIDWHSFGTPTLVGGEELLRAAGLTAAACLLVRAWPGHGQRHEARLVLAGFLARCGMGQDNAECFIEAVLNAAGDDDIADASLCIQSSFKKHEAGENVCGVPKLIETFGEKRGKKIAEWTGYKDKQAKPGKSQALTVVQMGGEISAFDEHPTDLGNSRVLVRLNEGDIRYCHAFKAWFIWTGTYWRRDDNGEVMRRAAGAVHFMLSSAIALDHEDPQRGPRIGWALASERRQRLSDMKALAQDDERAVLDYRLLDADPLLIGVLNGDLRTGEFREGRREDFITKRANVNYEPDAKCPNWLKFQEKISGAHPGLIDYKQRAFGLTLSGEVPEILWICHGSGSNGKTTELETISDILGDYAHASDASILIAEKNQGGATPEIVALKDKRAVFVNETGQNDWLNEARVKYISATDTMSGRNLFEGIVNWKPTHKPFLRTNHRPKVKGTDLGIWRRIHYVPYTLTISRSDAILNFKETCLIPEKAGIFNWMLGGWLAYLNFGRKLNPPPCVQEANESYQKDSDITGRWIDSAIKPAPGAKVSLKQLHDAYVLWFRGEIGEKGYIAIQTLANRLEEKGYIREKSSSHSKGTLFADLRMVPMFPEMDAALDTMPNHGVFKERGDGGIQQSISQSISHTRVTRETLGKTPSDAPIPPIEYEEEEHPHMSSRNHSANFLEGNIPKTAPKKPKAGPKSKKVKVYDTEWSPSDPPPETKTGLGAAGLFPGYVRASSPLAPRSGV